MTSLAIKESDFEPEMKDAAIKYCHLMKEDPLEVITFTNPFGLDRIKGPRWMSHIRMLIKHRACHKALGL